MKPLKRNPLISAILVELLKPKRTQKSITSPQRNEYFKHSCNEKLSPYNTINS